MLGGIEKTAGKDEWLTPPYILQALGEFDIDPCSPIDRPWDTAKEHLSIMDDGLSKPWGGRVWCNPPYGNKTGIWLARMADHGNGIALVFARTETRMFFEHVWPSASALFFFSGRLSFCHVTGRISDDTAGAPSVLIAYGENNSEALRKSGLNGWYVDLHND